MELFNWFMKQINSILEYSSHHGWAALLCFFTIFVGPYIIYLHISLRGQKKVYAEHRQYSDWLYSKLKIEEIVDPPVELWKEIHNSISIFSLSKKENREAIYNELHEDLVDIFGEDYREKFPLPGAHSDDFYDASNNNYWAENLLLAHRGYATPLISLSGYNLGIGDRTAVSIAICKKIEYYLRKAHPDHESDFRLYLQGLGCLEKGEVQTAFNKTDNMNVISGGAVFLKITLERNHRIGLALW